MEMYESYAHEPVYLCEHVQVGGMRPYRDGEAHGAEYEVEIKVWCEQCQALTVIKLGVN